MIFLFYFSTAGEQFLFCVVTKFFQYGQPISTRVGDVSPNPLKIGAFNENAYYVWSIQRSMSVEFHSKLLCWRSHNHEKLLVKLHHGR